MLLDIVHLRRAGHCILPPRNRLEWLVPDPAQATKSMRQS